MQNQHCLFGEELEPEAKKRAHIVLAPLKQGPPHDVFAEAILEDASSHQRRSPFDWIASVSFHLAILAVLFVFPLYFTAVLDSHKLNLTFLAPPAMPAAAPVGPLTSSAALRPTRVLPERAFNPRQLTAPTFIPKAIVNTAGAGELPDEAFMSVPGGLPGGIPGGQVGGVLGGSLTSKDMTSPVPPVVQGPKAPVRVGGNVKPPRLLFGPQPDYPILARQSRLSGIVIIEAVIDERGTVTGMRVVSGHPLLIPAALSAVSKRRYEPTVLDGVPTPIDLRVEITFSFS